MGREHGCFRFDADAGMLNWFEAQDYCNNLHENAFLAEIKSGATQELLAEYANSIADHNWWLGGADFFQVRPTSSSSFSPDNLEMQICMKYFRKGIGDGNVLDTK